MHCQATVHPTIILAMAPPSLPPTCCVLIMGATTAARTNMRAGCARTYAEGTAASTISPAASQSAVLWLSRPNRRA